MAVGEDHNLRRGWLTLGKGLSSSSLEVEEWARQFDTHRESCLSLSDPLRSLVSALPKAL